MKKNGQVSDFSELRPGDVIRIVPDKSQEGFEYYHRPSKPRKYLVLWCLLDHDQSGRTKGDVMLSGLSADKNVDFLVSSDDRGDYLFFCGELTGETYEYAVELIERRINEPEARGINEAVRIVKGAYKDIQGFDWADPYAVAAYDYAWKKQAHVVEYLEKKCRDLATGKDHPLIYSV